MTVSVDISSELKQAIKRKNISQVQLSKKINRSPSTVNAYIKNQPAPIEAIQDIAEVLNDSMLNVQLANQFFGTIPAMEATLYQDHPHVLDFLQQVEAEERKAYKQVALKSLSKQDCCLSKEDLNHILNYANEYLDEMLIEMRLVMSILSKADVSVMQAINNRKPYWRTEGYLGGKQ